MPGRDRFLQQLAHWTRQLLQNHPTPSEDEIYRHLRNRVLAVAHESIPLKMKLPPNHTEAQVLAIIDKVVNQLARSFVFGHYDIDDIKQFGRLKAVELLTTGSYDPSRPLEAWIYTHVRNRYINLRRDKLTRYDPPCLKCAAGTFCGDGPCKKFRDWKGRNSAKASLQRPMDLNHVADEAGMHSESDVDTDATIHESLRLIDEHLPIGLRQTYLQMRDGVSVPKCRRLQVEAAVTEILKGDVGCSTEDL